MPGSPVPASDDKLTIISIAAVACVLQDFVHEALGHGLFAWFSGAHHLTLSTIALQSDIQSRWISAAGTLLNFAFALIFWLLLVARRRYRPALHYFLILALAGNLLSATGYFCYSGVANFGDWADVIQGLHPYLAWRFALIVVGAVTYYLSLLLIAAQFKPFYGRNTDAKRFRGLCWIPYFAEGVLAGVAGLLNPLGLFYVAASALASTLGGNSGMLFLPTLMRWRGPVREDATEPLPRSPAWIVLGVVSALVFIFVLGRGISWTR